MNKQEQDAAFELAMMTKLGVTAQQLRHPNPPLARRLSREAAKWLRAKEREQKELDALA